MTTIVPGGDTEGNGHGRIPPAPQHVDLEIVLDEKSLKVPAAGLMQDDACRQFQARCQQAQSDPVFVIHDLLSWPDEARWPLFQLLVGLGRRYEIRFHDEATCFDCLFRAVLHKAEAGGDVGRTERALRAAKEAAFLVFPNALLIAGNQIIARFRELGLKGLLPQTMSKELKLLAGTQSSDLSAADAALRFHDHLREACELTPAVPAIRYHRDDFYIRDHHRWRRHEDRNFMAQVTSFLQQDPDYADPTGRFVNDVIVNLKGLTLLDRWDLPMPIWITNEMPLEAEPSPWIALSNGMIDISAAIANDDVPIPFELDPKHFSEVVLNYDFDPKAQCPIWERTLAEIFPALGADDHRIQILQEFMGWSLVTADMQFERFLILVGKGGNGKSTILKIWRFLLGPENVSHVAIDQLNSEFRLEQMMGKLANISADMGHVDKVAEGWLKQLVSGDPIQINRKHKAPLTMNPTAKLVFACNSLPQLNDRSDGIWRRLLVLPFLHQFRGEAIDLKRADCLRDELSGILNWAIDGARRLYRQRDFTPCDVCQNSAATHRTNSDPFLQFVQQKTTRGSGQVSTHQTKMYKEYRQFCEDNGRRAKNSADFKLQMLDLPGVTESRPGSGNSRSRCYLGIALI